MVVEIRPEHERMIDLAIRSGAYRDPGEVLETALSMLSEDIEDGAISEARSAEPRYTLSEVEEELRALGKLK